LRARLASTIFLHEAKPEDKMALIKREQAKGKLVAMDSATARMMHPLWRRPTSASP